ncbi:MAG: hypothetical protein ACPGOY_08000 [Rhodospirillaceae bacterium]
MVSQLIVFGEVYLWVGLAFAVFFLLYGADLVMPDLRRSYVVRPLLFPAALLLWPLVAWRFWVLWRGLAPDAKFVPGDTHS